MYYTVDIFFRNVHHLSDGRFAAGIWAKHASFNFDKTSEHYISPVDAAEIIGWMSGPVIVAEFGKEATPQSILETTNLLKINNIAIPFELLTPMLEDKFDSIFITDKTVETHASFSKTITENPLAIYECPIHKEAAEKIQESNTKTICLHGIPEDKPGMADYEDLSIFMEYLEE